MGVKVCTAQSVPQDVRSWCCLEMMCERWQSSIRMRRMGSTRRSETQRWRLPVSRVGAATGGRRSSHKVFEKTSRSLRCTRTQVLQQSALIKDCAVRVGLALAEQTVLCIVCSPTRPRADAPGCRRVSRQRMPIVVPHDGQHAAGDKMTWQAGTLHDRLAQ